MAQAQTVSYELPSTTESLAKVEQFVEEIKNSHGISEDVYGNILVCLSEAVNNAIKHGNKFAENKIVNFHFEKTKSAIMFYITDQGNGFDFNNVPDPTHPDNIEKLDGRGIFIMNSLADKVEFTEEGRKLELNFSI